jgi:quinone-reactive Ni/Fe-hydrogenase small subunit
MPADRRALFATGFGPARTPPGSEDRPELRRECEARLRELAKMEPLSGLNLRELLAEHGIKRRTFLAWASATTAALMLPATFEPLVAKAAELANRIPVLWIECQDCAGNSEAFLRSSGPTVDELLLEMISLQYHETLMAAAGFQAEQLKEQAAKAFHGRYLLVIEGAIPLGLGGAYGTIGPAAKTFLQEVQELSAGAGAVIAAGSCAFYGGVPEAHPNPTGAVGVTSVVSGTPVVNVPACPMNPVNFVGLVLHYTLTGQLPELDSQLRPVFAFGNRIHDNCDRRAHFDAGEYVQQWGDAGAQSNFCLYKMGCKGPMTYNNCSTVLYNEGTSWPIGAGHGCIGCSEKDFWDTLATEVPLANASIEIPGFGQGVEASVDKFGLGLLAATAVGITAHAAASAVANRRAAAAARATAGGPAGGGPAGGGPVGRGPAGRGPAGSPPAGEPRPGGQPEAEPPASGQPPAGSGN